MDRQYGTKGRSASDLSCADVISALRTACCWFEWGDPSDLKAAGALQDAADAVRDGKLDLGTARILLDGYRARSLALAGGAR
jgi:hypothetical protein